LFHDIAASVLHRRQTLCSLPSFPAINGATSADRDSPAPVVPPLPSPSPSPYLVAPKTLVSVLFALIRLLQFLFINCDGLRQLDPSIPGFSLRRCAGILPFSSSAITNIFASFPFVTCVLLAANNGYLSSAVVSVIQACCSGPPPAFCGCELTLYGCVHLTIVVCSRVQCSVILSSQARDVWSDGTSAGASPPSPHVICADEIVSATPPCGLPAPLSHPFVRR
jgi:hypothetical protein